MDKGPTVPDSSSARRFSREEAALILRRATEGEQRGENRIEDGLTLAEIVAATVLCGEISLGTAIVADEWVSSHDQYGRNR